MTHSNSTFASPPIDVSVVLPVYNEAGHLREEIDRIRKSLEESDYSFEIIVVDDGSSDGSGESLAQIDGIRVLRFRQNRGAGSARKYGTMVARGRYVAWTDVDMSYPNDELPRLLDEINGWDQVVGHRTSEQGTVKLLRRPAKWFIRRLASYLTKVPIPDLNSGFRVFRRDVAMQFLYLLPRGFSCVTTITLAFLTNGYSVTWVPIDYAPRRGNSKFHWLVDTRRYLMQVVRMVLMYEPLRVFGPPAATLGLVGIGKLIYDLIDKDLRVGTNTILILGASVAFALLGTVTDLLVQLNKERNHVLPAVTDSARADLTESA
jgi:polyisoprenyl-phosphate glycosyltransferase